MDKKVRNELVCLLVAWSLAVINILKIIYKKERKYVNPIAKLGFEVYDRYLLYII